MEQKKVKAVWWNDASRTREFTKVAFEMITHEKGWILADDQTPIEQKKTNPAVAPAVVNAHNENELRIAREQYKTITGQDAPKEWNEPKLWIETEKAKKAKAAQPEPVKVEEPEVVDLPTGTDEQKPKKAKKTKVAAE